MLRVRFNCTTGKVQLQIFEFPLVYLNTLKKNTQFFMFTVVFVKFLTK